MNLQQVNERINNHQVTDGMKPAEQNLHLKAENAELRAVLMEIIGELRSEREEFNKAIEKNKEAIDGNTKWTKETISEFIKTSNNINNNWNVQLNKEIAEIKKTAESLKAANVSLEAEMQAVLKNFTWEVQEKVVENAKESMERAGSSFQHISDVFEERADILTFRYRDTLTELDKATSFQIYLRRAERLINIFFLPVLLTVALYLLFPEPYRYILLGITILGAVALIDIGYYIYKKDEKRRSGSG